MPFDVKSDTTKWFTQFVRPDVIIELEKLAGSPLKEWPSADKIINNTGGHPARILRTFLKRFQGCA